MARPVIRIDEVGGMPMAPEGGSERFGATVAPVGGALGLTQLGLTVIEVPPGKRAFPFHNHLGADEAFVILEGSGTYRFGESEHAVSAGCICGAPKGGPDTAHQLVNIGEGALRYIALSSRSDPEVVEYPDSGKYAALAIAPGTSFADAHLRALGRASESLDYWDGEEL